MSLVECMRKVSYPEFQLWMDYFARDMNRPSRSDYYAMQVAAEVRRTNVKHPDRVKVGDCELHFTEHRDNATSIPPPSGDELEQEEPLSKDSGSPPAPRPPSKVGSQAELAASKARWFAIAGRPETIVKVSKEG